MKKFRIIFVSAGVVLLIYLFSRPTTANNVAVRPDESLFQSGDIIFRDGRGVISSIFRNMSLSDNSFSHAGIIHREGNDLFVYHVIGGERNNSPMRKEKLSDFCSISEAFAIGVYRTDLDPKLIDSLAGKFYSQRIGFDDKFSLTTDDKMYCTEFVYKVLSEVSGRNNFLPLTTVNEITYCACDNIFLSPHLKKITIYKVIPSTWQKN